MNSKIISSVLLCCIVVACNVSTNDSNNSATQAQPTPAPITSNAIHILVSPNTDNQGICSNANIPCVTVTICSPNNIKQCDQINNILLDTGSYGLRVFASLLPNNHNGESLAPILLDESINECVRYGDGTTNWGPVKRAIVGLNNNYTTESIPIQILDSTSFSNSASSVCPSSSANPSQLRLNGILGVGPFANDQTVGVYYTCANNSCNRVQSLADSNDYVLNPITKFANEYNNGLTLQFGGLPENGAINADGYAIFGVGSNQDNTPPSTATILPIESGINGIPINIITGISPLIESPTFLVYNSFLDTGSNFLYFDSTTILNLSQCQQSVFLCPPTLTPFLAIMLNSQESLSPFAKFNFAIANSTDVLLNTNNTAFSNIGAILSVGGIDWGLPFYFGKTVYSVFANESVTFNGKTYPPSPNGYWIY